MMAKAKPEVNYETLKSELDAILADLQRDDLDVDTALRSYQRGLELTRQLETYLRTAENKISQLKVKFDADAA